MRTTIFLIGTLFLFFNCSGNNKIEKKEISNMDYQYTTDDSLSSIATEIKYPGIVVILSDSIEFLEKPILVRNEKGKIINKLSFDKNEKIVKFEKGIPTIREYYPDYSIIIFDGYPLENNKYKVILNDSVFFLDNIIGYTIFEKWEEHIARAFIATNELNPLRETPAEKGKIIPIDYKNSNFIVIEVENDWIKVECDLDCEGCPDGNLVSGWIRWRKDNEILVKLYYSC